MQIRDLLLRPFDYLRIQHDSKSGLDWKAPFYATAVLTIAFVLLNHLSKIDLFSAAGLTQKILGFVQSLPGFYIAALAAIATFNKADIDFVMPSPAPKLPVKIKGKLHEIDLTRRRFLCAMFAFLTAESLIIIILAIAAPTVSDAIKNVSPIFLHTPFKTTFFCIIVFLMSQLLVCTFLGLYYLGYRLHQPAPANRTLATAAQSTDDAHA